MRKLSPRVFTEIHFWGCNPSFVTTGEGVVMINIAELRRLAHGIRCVWAQAHRIRGLIGTFVGNRAY